MRRSAGPIRRWFLAKEFEPEVLSGDALRGLGDLLDRHKRASCHKPAEQTRSKDHQRQQDRVLTSELLNQPFAFLIGPADRNEIGLLILSQQGALANQVRYAIGSFFVFQMASLLRILSRISLGDSTPNVLVMTGNSKTVPVWSVSR